MTDHVLVAGAWGSAISQPGAFARPATSRRHDLRRPLSDAAQDRRTAQPSDRAPRPSSSPERVSDSCPPPQRKREATPLCRAAQGFSTQIHAHVELRIRVYRSRAAAKSRIHPVADPYTAPVKVVVGSLKCAAADQRAPQARSSPTADRPSARFMGARAVGLLS